MRLIKVQNENFFKLMHELFEAHHPDQEFTVLATQRKLTLKGRASLKFPVRDVAQVDVVEDELIVTCEFMGLYGVDSPLPFYFNDLSLRSDDGESLRAFLDVLNHRIYVLYYLAWQAFQVEAAAGLLLALGGLRAEYDGIKGIYGDEACFANLILQCRNILPSIPMAIEPVEGWVKLSEQCKLGMGEILGEDVVLGAYVYESISRVCIKIGPIDCSFAQQLLTDDRIICNLLTRIKSCLQGVIPFDLVLWVKSVSNGFYLGLDKTMLGCSSWLGLSANDGYLALSVKPPFKKGGIYLSMSNC